MLRLLMLPTSVTSRKGRVSRNVAIHVQVIRDDVTSRKGRVSRNDEIVETVARAFSVTSRKGRVSRNMIAEGFVKEEYGHVP